MRVPPGTAYRSRVWVVCRWGRPQAQETKALHSQLKYGAVFRFTWETAPPVYIALWGSWS